MKTCAFLTLGCKVNQYETQEIRDRFLEYGLRETTLQEMTDVCVINTCAVTGVSEGKSRRLIKRIAREHPESKIVVTGCYIHTLNQPRTTGGAGQGSREPKVVHRNGSGRARPDKIQEIDGVDYVVSNKDKEHIPELLGLKTVSNIEYPVSSLRQRTRAILKVQDGCNLSCSYCIIPFIRGRSVSKPLEEVYEEAIRLVERCGHKEIILTGIHLGSYGQDLTPKVNLPRPPAGEAGRQTGLINLLERLTTIKGLERIRLSSIELNEISDELLDFLIPTQSVGTKVCPHLHIPLQSGSNNILKRMNRRYQVEEFINRLEEIRRKINNPSFTTDVMVGFPGETDNDFAETLRACEQARFSKIHIFPYSDRPGTRAFQFVPKVKPEIIRARVKTLKQLARRLALEYKKPFMNQEVEILLEGKERKSQVTSYPSIPSGGSGREPQRDKSQVAGILSGFTTRYLRVFTSLPAGQAGASRDLINQLVKVKINRITPEWMHGERIG